MKRAIWISALISASLIASVVLYEATNNRICWTGGDWCAVWAK